MIRVMIVEDEPPILRQISKLIDDFGGEFKVTATAGNGKKALELLEEEPADVVFSDIKMPVIDGLELTEQLKIKYPNIIVVIISGYQDFQYARKAIQFHVYEYLLKPVSKDAIGKVLTDIKSEIMQKREREKKEKVLNSINSSDNALYNETMNISSDIRYALFLICIGAFPLVPDDSMLPARNFWKQVDIEQALHSTMLEDESCTTFHGKSAAEMITAVEVKDAGRIPELANDLLERLKDKSNFTITIAAGNELISLKDIGTKLKALRTKLYVGIKLFSSQILWDDIEISNPNIDTKLMSETLNYAIKSGSTQLKRCLMMTVGQFVNTGFTQLQIVNFFDGVINNIELVDYKTGDSVSTLKMEIYSAISNAADINTFTDDLAYILSSINSSEADSKKSGNNSIVEKIEQYLKNNYSETITNTLLSKKFGFVPSYISKIFREQKGLSPSEYLTNYRIDMSKKIMLEQPDILLREVAEKVGYNDQHYFSKIFKKETGMWPTEYRSEK